MVKYSIGEIAERAKLATSTIRYYEQLGLLPEPPRASGQRRYDASVLQPLAFIRFAKAAGFTLAEIKGLLDGLDGKATHSERWHILAHQKLSEVDALIQQAQEMKRLLQEGLACHCASLDECTVVNVGDFAGRA